MAQDLENHVLNLNIGILGHVDSGKTSLAKALSTTASTASFDKNPQSQERGITLDLGFSSLLVEMPNHLKDLDVRKNMQFTLVDCPGHASLIRTIIGGHVDSGKTSLAKALSTTASTASFDKNPQSQERGITLDLGFSSLLVEMPNHLKDLDVRKNMQFTLVDCPGHASLIRTIIGGSQIIDMMILVIDVVKGMQTQTAECLVIGEITCQKMVVVLNKVDLLPEMKRAVLIEKMSKKMKLTLASSIFKDSPIVSIAASPGGLEDPTRGSSVVTRFDRCIVYGIILTISWTADHGEIEVQISVGIPELIEALRKFAFIPKRHVSSPFLFAVDHCFAIRGQGTVMTGTILQGAVNINDVIEIPQLQVTKKVKSMQMFRQPVVRAVQGDRVGICVTQFDPKTLERGMLCQPGHISKILSAIVSAKKIKYFKDSIKTKERFHISLGYETVMAKVTIFGVPRQTHDKKDSGRVEETDFNFDREYKYQDELISEVQADRSDETDVEAPQQQFALLEFDKPVLAVPKCLVIGSKLDKDIYTNTCRLAFHGTLLTGFDDKSYTTTILPRLKVYKEKCKTGIVERLTSENDVIVIKMFKKETNLQVFIGLKVFLTTGEEGIIDSSFGQSGKVKVHIP
ncbi:unnamed protein product, partial [Timema podura]|nr:unnamed protein product [Timema podura]